ncbi:MAG TPA: UDP-2,3-diacylglucosamine diphosphatase [Longimicrobiales bacterium]|nr:UDP-2,3-diacylglucosamine diphosphatase [Longimicrobiales bacterium]
MTKPVYIASDVHLGAVPRETERRFLRFLEHVGAHASSLLLPGDLFDFWFEYGDVVPGEHFRVLAALASLVEAGVPVAMVGGNHDAWGGRFLRERVGMTYTPGELRTTLGGKPALVVHGDGVGRGDLKYRALKAVIRGRLAIGAFRVLHPELGLRLARRVSSTEAKADEDASSRGRARYIEAWARSTLEAEPALGFVVCGHAHVPALVEVEPGRWYVNAGDWVRHFTYVVVGAGGEPEMRRWGA